MGPDPKFFGKVYFAFDEGEYYHGNNRDEDPLEVYTRPRIARVVEALGIGPVAQPPRLNHQRAGSG